jgi:hypothetical protein
MAICDRQGFLVAVFLSQGTCDSVTCASPHKVTLVEDVLAARFTNALPERFIGDNTRTGNGRSLGDRTSKGSRGSVYRASLGRFRGLPCLKYRLNGAVTYPE